MDKISLGDIGTWLAFFAAIIGSSGVIFASVKKALGRMFEAQTKDIQAKLAQQEAAILRIDTEACKNYLVSFLSRAERCERHEIDEIEKARFWEQYEHYEELGGNSYIKNKVEALKKGGKL